MSALFNNLIFYNLVFCFYVFSTHTAMGVMNSAFGLVFLYWASFRVLKSAKTPPIYTLNLKEYYYFIAIFIMAALVSTASVLFYPYLYAGHAPTMDLHAPQKLWYFFIPILMVDFFAHLTTSAYDRLLKNMLTTWWWSTILFSGIALIQFKTGWPLAQPIPTLPGYYHAILFLGHHLSVASVFIFSTFAAGALCVGHFALLKNKSPFPTLEFCAFISGCIILFLSYARTAWLTLPIGLFFLMFYYFYLVKKLTIKRIVFSIALISFLLLLLFQFTAIQTRVENLMGVQERFLLWKANLDYFYHRPFTGIGWLKTQEMVEYYFKSINPEHYHQYFFGHAHNNFLELLGGAGLLGLGAFLAFMVFSILYTLDTAKRLLDVMPSCSFLAMGIAIALVLLHVNGLTNVNFLEGKVFQQQMLALSMVMIMRMRYLTQFKLCCQ